MEYTAKYIAELLHAAIEGDPEVKIHNVSKIEEGKSGTLTFLANPKYTEYIYDTEASAVIVDKNFKPLKPVRTTLIRVENSYEAFAKLLALYQSEREKRGIEDFVHISKSAVIHDSVYIGAFSYIDDEASIAEEVKIYPQVYIGENVKIGKRTVIYPGVKIYADTVIGENCIIHAGCVIGSDGFGFAPKSKDTFSKVPQIGNVIVDDEVEIGANTCIDRATLGNTHIQKGVKLDNLIQVAHNVSIGENTVIAAQTGISGSSKLGDNCMIGGQVGIAGHLQIADGIKIGAQSGLSKSFPEKDEMLFGTPAMNYRKAQKVNVVMKDLPELRNKIYRLEKELEKLKSLLK